MVDNPIQGLRVSLKLADALDTIEILSNLNLDIGDLDRIRGIADAGVEQTDVIALSGLTADLDKEVVAIYNETKTYPGLVSNINDGRRRIPGNLDITGQIIAPSFKFNKVDFDKAAAINPPNAPNPLINPISSVDFSTSRASAWSSFGNPIDSIFYGGDVILDGIPDGVASSIELSALNSINTGVKKRRFASQIPTHKIRVNIDGLDYDLYAMKGIPLKFKGFFRSVNSTIRIDFAIIGSISPSWVLRNLSNGIETVISNRMAGSGPSRNSTITYFDASSIERDIEFYYPVDPISRISLDEVKIYNIPNVKINSMRRLDVINGDLIEMPDLRSIYPGLTYLNLTNNDLSRSNTVELRTFSQDVVNRLPTTLVELYLNRNVYKNNCTADLSVLPALQVFSADNTNSAILRMSGTSPAIGPSVITYNVAAQIFSTLHPTVMASNTLKTLNIRSNGLTTVISNTNLAALENFTSGGNSHPIFDIRNKTNFRYYQSDSMSFPVANNGNIGTNIFEGCTNLQTINIGYTNVSGALPDFSSNINLVSFYSVSTAWLDADNVNCIKETTFGVGKDALTRTKLVNFDLRSSNLRNPIHPNAFTGMVALRNLFLTSNGAGITGNYPTSLNECYSLLTLNLTSNKLSGILSEQTNFSNNKALTSLDLSYNRLEGAFPTLNLPNLRTVQLVSNLFTAIGNPLCRSLTYINGSNNLLQTVPNFDGAPAITDIYLNNNANMTYTSGIFRSPIRLRRLEMANCGFNTGTIDAIINDLNTNYNRAPRRGVVINLLGNAAPSATIQINTIITRLRRNGWTLGLVT